MRQREFHAQLRGFANAHGYKFGWADHTFRQKFGDWPPKSWRALEPHTPGREVTNFVQYRQIRRVAAKRRQLFGAFT